MTRENFEASWGPLTAFRAAEASLANSEARLQYCPYGAGDACECPKTWVYRGTNVYWQRPHWFSDRVAVHKERLGGMERVDERQLRGKKRLEEQQLGCSKLAEPKPRRIAMINAAWMERQEEAAAREPIATRTPQKVMNSPAKAIEPPFNASEKREERADFSSRLPAMTKSQERDMRRRFLRIGTTEGERQNRFDRISRPWMNSKPNAITRRFSPLKITEDRVNRFNRIPTPAMYRRETAPERQVNKTKLMLKGPGAPKLTLEQQFEEIASGGERAREGRRRGAPKRFWEEE